MWEESSSLTLTAIARAFTLIYTLSLLTLLTRIQLNLLGRRNYLASVVSLASPPAQESKISLENHDDDNFEHAYGNDFETNRRYLSFSWWLLHRGCIDLLQKVQQAVEDVFGSLNPREEISLGRLSELTLEVRKKVEGTTPEQRRDNKWLAYLLPPTQLESHVLAESGMPEPHTPPTPSLRRLLDETSDLIDSPSFTHVLTLLLDAAFSHLIDVKISALAYKLPPLPTETPSPSARTSMDPFGVLPPASTARITDITELEDRAAKKAKVANSLAIFCRQAHQIGSGANNEYLQAIEAVAQLEAFAAVVYSSNFEFEMPDVEAAAQAPAIPETRPGTSGTVGTETPRYADVVREHGEAEGASISLPGTESYANIAKEAATVEKINVFDGEGKGETAEGKLAAEIEVKKETEKVEEKAEGVARDVESGFESAWKKAEDVAKAGNEVV